jgi:hypothetical protein
MPSANHLVFECDVLASEITDGEVRVNLGFQGGIGGGDEDKGIALGAPSWGMDGFVAVPNDPTDDGVCRATYVVDGDEKRVIAMRDGRYADKVGEFGPGDRAIVTAGEARIMLKAEADSVAMYTVNSKVDLSQLISIDGSTGITLLLNGNSYIQIDDDEITLAINDGASITINKDGVQILGGKFEATCASGSLGQLVPGVPPPPGLNSILKGVSGVTGVPSSAWVVGT